MKYFSVFITLLILAPASHADVNCKWIPTFEKPVEEVAALVEERSGKKPTVSCGAGKDYKVCHSCVDKYTPEQWEKLKEMLAEPSYRQWHASWHISELDQDRPFWRAISEQNGHKPAEVHGESFLYMHREMIRALNANAGALGLPCMNGWTKLPSAADDPEWPTVDAQNLSNDTPVCQTATPEMIRAAGAFERRLAQKDNMVIAQVERDIATAREQYKNDPAKLAEELARIFEKGEADKAKNRTDLLTELKLTEEQVSAFANCSTRPNMEVINQDFKKTVALTEVEAKPEYLKSHTMGAMGSDVASHWHGQLHGIYDSSPPHVCTRGDVRPYCDNMAQFSSSHVNIHFYKVHGLVDNYIDKWLEQNGYETAAKDCAGKAKCYTWHDTWSSTPPDFVTGEGCALGVAPPLVDPFPSPIRPVPPFLKNSAGKMQKPLQKLNIQSEESFGTH